jgi:hypothetical protein
MIEYAKQRQAILRRAYRNGQITLHEYTALQRLLGTLLLAWVRKA